MGTSMPTIAFAVEQGIDLAIQWAFEQKIIPRRLSLEELFDDVTASLNP